MDQQTFEQTFANLPPRRKDVLRRILMGETDAEIATSLKIDKSTVRKHIERLCQAFHLDDGDSGERRSRRSDIVTLVAKYKPELLQDQGSASSQEVIDGEIVQVDTLGDLSPSMQPITEGFSGIVWQLWMITQQLEKVLADLLKLHSESQEAHDIARGLNKLGYKSYMEGDFQKATFYLEWAIRFHPDLEAAYYNLGSAYEKLENLPAARIHYQQATRYSRRGAHAAISNLARLEILQGNSQAAIAQILPVLDKAEDAMVKSSLHKNLGWAYLLQEDYDQAKEHLEAAIALNSERASAYCLLAQVQEALGVSEHTLRCWENCLKYDSSEQRVQAKAWRSPELDEWQLRARQRLKPRGTVRN